MKNVLLTIDNKKNLDDVVKELELKGFYTKSILNKLGVISGNIESIDDIKNIDGILNIKLIKNLSVIKNS